MFSESFDLVGLIGFRPGGPLAMLEGNLLGTPVVRIAYCNTSTAFVGNIIGELLGIQNDTCHLLSDHHMHFTPQQKAHLGLMIIVMW